MYSDTLIMVSDLIVTHI